MYSAGNVCGFDTDVWNEKERWDSMNNKLNKLENSFPSIPQSSKCSDFYHSRKSGR